MHAPTLRPRRFALALCMLAAVALGPVAAALPASSKPTGASHIGREATTRAKLATVRAKIRKIAAAQHATAAKRETINAKLAAQAIKLDHAANALHQTDVAIAAQTKALANLQHQRTRLRAKLHSQRAALAELLRAVYTLDRGSNLSLLLGGDDIAKISRALAYSHYFQRDRVQRIHKLLEEVARLDSLKASIDAKTATLEQQRGARAARMEQRKRARVAQRELLVTADQQLARQKDKLAALRHHEHALNALLKRLKNVFADIPKRIGKTPPFATLKGKLPWPVAGKPRTRSGAPAHGIVIAAKPGAEVHAVAYGRVAWADFMRGYGMLVIIDQGKGWMSLYGGNEAALVEVGDWVKPGQPIATVGADPSHGGAWFGLRHDGKPVTPEGWFAHGR